MKHLVVRSATPEAKKLVLNIIRTNERPLTIQELYEEATSSQEHTEIDGNSTIPSMRCEVNLTSGLSTSFTHIHP